MSESEQVQDAAPKFSKAMLGRILAVGFFVALGTFAVIQSMGGTKLNAVSATVNLPSTDTGADDNPADSFASDGTAKTEVEISNTTKSPIANFDPKKTAKTNTTGFEPKTFVPPAGNLNKGTSTPVNKSFAGQTNGTPPAANSFNPTRSFTPPDKKPGFEMPVVTSKPIAKPPARYAQMPTGVPIIANEGGFGSMQQKPEANRSKVPATSYGDNPITAKMKTAAKTTNDATARLKSEVSAGAGDLLRSIKDKASEKGNAAVDAMKQDIGNRFGPVPPKTAGAFGGSPTNNAKSSLSPPDLQPKVQTGFGDRPRALSGPSKNFAAAQPAKKDDSGFEGTGNRQSVLPITSRLTNDPIANARKSTGPFGESNPASQPKTNSYVPPTQSLKSPSTQRSNVPMQSISTGQPSNRSTYQQNPNSRFGSDNTRGSTSSPAGGNRLNSIRPPATTNQVDSLSPSNNINSRVGTGSSILSSNSTSLSKNVPGDRQLEGIQAPSLTIEKLSPREIQVNQTASFEIVVKNVGRATADEVQVLDQVPAGTEFKGSTPEPTRIAQDRGIEWNLGQLRPGQEKRIKFQLKTVQPGEIGSVARVTFATRASMRTQVTKPVLEIVHQTNPTHLIGNDVVLDVVVTNKGDGPAKNVMIQQDVPKQLDFPDGLPGGSRGIEYEIGTLMPGKSRRIKLALKAANVGKIQNVMFASADGGLRAKHQLPIEVVAPKLVARSDGATKRFLKRNVTHQFIVANRGTANATNVELIARLPNGLRYIQSNNQGRYDSNTHAVYWSLAELARDIEAKVELKTMPVGVGNQPIKFESTADLNVRSNVEHALTVEHLVDVFFDIDDVVDPIEIGSDTSYRLRVVNQGTKAASNVQLQVDFPAGLQPTSVDGSLRHNIRGQQIVFEPINSMNSGDELSIVIHGKGQTAGDHRVVASMRTDGRTTAVSKQESTRVYSDR